MKNILFSVFLCVNLTVSIKAQVIKVFYETKNHGFVLYVDNYELCPVSLSFDLNLSNLAFSEGDKKIFIVPSKSEKFKIGELTAVNIGQTKFDYKYKSTLGDVTQTNYDTSFIYDLPFQKGKTYKIGQGYNGTFSHQNENALDFNLPEGSEIVAARDGMVVQIVQNNTESCPREECKKYNNQIFIMHSDGTFGCYAHIRYNGSICKLGDNIKKGDVIAYSGNVGWSSGPHLHFACFLGGFEKWQSLETKFRIDKGDRVEILKEGNQYSRDY
ncbi:MAG: M23 family metallopeptidase [Ginsengibacter sp.]